VPLPGLEPGLLSETNFESAATANFTIGALVRMVFERLQITSLLLYFFAEPILGSLQDQFLQDLNLLFSILKIKKLSEDFLLD